MTLTAMLLSGGRSRRMGRDKATVLIGGEPLWQRQLRILSGLRPDAVWLSAGTVPPWCPRKIEVVVDKRPSSGPLSGIVAGSSRLESSHLLVLAIDLPQMTTEHLTKLCASARPGTGVIPFHADHFEPLCAICPIEALGAAETALSSDDVSVQHFAQSLLRKSQAQVFGVIPEETPLYLNMNTPSDLPKHAQL